MKKIAAFALASVLSFSVGTASAQLDVAHMNERDNDQPNFYLGLGVTSIALDDERTDFPTRSPGHQSRVGGLFFGYQFNDYWGSDVFLGTDLSGEVEADEYALNVYRMFGQSRFRPFVSGGFSSFDVPEALNGDETTTQAQAGVGVSMQLSYNAELRLGYQHYWDLGDESFNDDAYTLALNWHFGQPPVRQAEAAAPMAESAPAPAPAAAPMPASETFEFVVEFDFDKSDIRPVYESKFAEMARIAGDGANVEITIEGHTDWIGTAEYNLALSDRRAVAVKDKLVNDYNVSEGIISTVGFGETKPIAENTTAEGRQRNRRAITVILKDNSGS